ncbi:MAG: nickel pincer cofactor biosynthesis protein LarC [Actinomycetota bacterium]|nr:nickel pincer cofactor biosynthesis protein LarC [Rubrobacteraceae bacterium]MDQ3251543.1 nickel pincer cofactor biosynthesis protein LarC [Actinomycetota bacterium]
MTLAALVAAGASLPEIIASLRGLGVAFDLTTERAEVNGVGALRADVEYPEEHSHRTFMDVRALIEDAALQERASSRALEAFRLLAVAEGAVHNQDTEEVTFHEVGAVDSIVDVVGSCVALELLDVASVSCGPLPMGTGVVDAAHGPLPVPGPATLEILEGSRVRWTDEPRETTTPTGAALMRSFTGGIFTDAPPPMTLRATGYGAGRMRLRSTPNLLRAVVGEIEGPEGGVELLEANVDDAPGELLGAAVERLLAAGAIDAWLEPIVMKRGRGAYKACALALSGDRERLARLMMRETGTLGVRHHAVGRTVAGRRRVLVTLPYGECLVKVGSIDGEDFVVAPEHADAARLAAETGLPLPRVYEDAKAAFGGPAEGGRGQHFSTSAFQQDRE